MNLRGRLMPVVSLRARMGIRGEWSRADARTVIVTSERRTAGLVVDDVREVLGVDARRYAAMRRGPDRSDRLVGTFRARRAPRRPAGRAGPARREALGRLTAAGDQPAASRDLR